MKYLTLVADYMEFALRGDDSEHAENEIAVPRELEVKLREWNDRYQAIMPQSMEERAGAETASLIQELDAIGLRLAESLSVSLGEAKVRYYSEGLFRYLS